MRASHFILSSFVLLAGGCASEASYEQWSAEAPQLGVTQNEIVSMTRQAGQENKMVVRRVEKTPDGAIAVWLSDKPNRPHGIVVIFRKIDGRWQEDPKSHGQWII